VIDTTEMIIHGKGNLRQVAGLPTFDHARWYHDMECVGEMALQEQVLPVRYSLDSTHQQIQLSPFG